MPRTGRARLSYRRAEELFKDNTWLLASPLASPEDIENLDGFTLHRLRRRLAVRARIRLARPQDVEAADTLMAISGEDMRVVPVLRTAIEDGLCSPAMAPEAGRVATLRWTPSPTGPIRRDLLFRGEKNNGNWRSRGPEALPRGGWRHDAERIVTNRSDS